MVEETLSFSNFICYAYYCGGTIAGPFYEYRDFMNFIELKKEYANVPSTISATLKKFITAIFFIGVNIFLEDHFKTDFLQTKEFAESSMIYKFFYSDLVMKTKVYTYYTAFCLIDAS